MRERFRWPALLLAMPFCAHAPELFGIVHADPSLFLSGLQRTQPASDLGAPYIDGNAGRTLQALGSLVAHDWLRGVMPWWNPYSGAGMPLAAAMQPGAFFLPFVLLLGASDGVMYMKLALQIVAGLSTYAALRERGLSTYAAGLAGVLFELNGTYAWYSDAPIMPIAFLPMLIWGIERTRSELARAGGFGPAIVAVAVAYSLVAGFPETAFLDGLLAGVWTIDAVVRSEGSRAVLARRVAAGLACGLLLAAAAVVPFALYLAVGNVGPHGSPVLGAVSASGMPALALPYVFGPIFDDGQYGEWGAFGGYVGSTVLLLAMAGAATQRARPGFGWALLAWLCIGLALVCGQKQLDHVRLMLPVLRFTLICRYALPSISFAAVTLSAMALDDWIGGRLRLADLRPRIAAVSAVWVAGLCIVLLRAAPRLRMDWPHEGGWMAASVVFALLCAGGSAWLLLRAPAPRQRAGFALLLGSQALLLFLPPVLAQPRSARLDMAPIDFLQNHLGLGRVFAMGGQLYANYSARYRVASIDYLSLPTPANWVTYVHDHLDPTTPPELFGELFNDDTMIRDLLERHAGLEEAGVSLALVSAAHDPLAEADAAVFRRVFTDGKASIYALLRARPYWDFAGARCDILAATRETLDAECDGPATLKRRELFFGDWQARVNGHRARISPASDVFQQISIPSGTSHVRFRYVPPFANLIAALFASGVVGLVALMSAARMRGFSTLRAG